MILKLAKKKEINEDVLRMIIQYGLGFASRVKNLENKEIENWKEDKLYEKGAKVLYNNYLWVAKVTNQSSTWNESYWEKVGDELELINKSDIEAMINLSDEDVKTLQSLILDTSIELSHVWSSSKTYGEIQNAIKKGEAFTLSKLASTMTASFEVATSTADMTQGNILYLLNTGTNTYDIYALISGTPTKIASTTIDLSQYAKLSDLNNYYDKATSDGKYATITTVDGKVDKTSILTTISTTATNKQAYGASVINTELDKKFDKDNILSIIQDTDNSKVFGAKAVYDTFNQKSDKINLYEIKEGEKGKHIVIDLPASHSISGKTTRLFVSDNILAIGLQIWNGATLEKDFRTPLINPHHIFIPTKALTPVSANVNFTNGDSSCNYTVINGMCYVNIWSMNITSNLSVETIFNNLPRAKVSAQFILSNAVGSKTVGMGWIGMGTQIIQCNVKLEDGTIKSQGYTRFSYPIDETWIPS